MISSLSNAPYSIINVPPSFQLSVSLDVFHEKYDFSDLQKCHYIGSNDKIY